MSDFDRTGLRTPAEWAALEGLVIYDPDGWRGAGDPPFDQPLTWEEYARRRMYSTTISAT